MPKKDSKKQTVTTKNKSEMPKTCPLKRVYKKCSKKQKIILSIIISVVAATIAAMLLTYLSGNEFKKTQIHTPVISRTELNKKSNIQIKVFDEDSAKQTVQSSEESKVNLKPKSVDSTKKEIKELTATQNIPKIEEITKQLSSLETSVKALQSLSVDATKVDELNKRISKLEGMEGNVGKLANIFLAQQLVLLDNAFKVGGNQNLAIKNIQEFAAQKAENKAVAEKLSDLLNLTQEQAIVTPQALLFYASKLERIKLQKIVKNEEKIKPTTFMGKIKAMLKSLISVRKNDEITAEKKLWTESINSLEESIIFADFVTTQKLLDDVKLQELGGEDFANFTKLFHTYLVQQQSLQAVLGAFIEGYHYDY